MNVLLNHQNKCFDINTTKEKFMPIQRVVQNGEVYYRYGDAGKLYRTKQEAEQQMKAMYAAGYKGPKDKKDAKN